MHKKQEIIEAAYDLFSQKGYALSMSDISDRVGIKTPSLYSHFSSKDEIVNITVKTEIETSFKQLDQVFLSVKDMSCEQQLKNIYLWIVGYFGQMQRLRFWKNISLINNEDLKEKCRKSIRENDIIYMEKIQQVFRQGTSNGELRETVGIETGFLFFTVFQGILDVILLHSEKDFNIKDFIIRTWEAYWDGIKKV